MSTRTFRRAVVSFAAAATFVGSAFAIEGTPEGDPVALARSAYAAYVSGDVQRSLADYRAAADLGHVGALWKLARIYENGEVGERRPHEAYKAYAELVSRHGSVPPRARDAVFVSSAFVSLGRMHELGIPGELPANPSVAASAYFQAASYFGAPEGQFQLGRMLIANGASAPDVFRRGVRWLKLAADKNHTGAIALLGNILFEGIHVEPNAVLGLSMLYRAKQSAPSQSRSWIDRMYAEASEAAEENVRRAAIALAKREFEQPS